MMGKCRPGLILMSVLLVLSGSDLKTEEICAQHPVKQQPQPTLFIATTSPALEAVPGEPEAPDGLNVSFEPSAGGGVCEDINTDRGKTAAAVGAILKNDLPWCSGVLVAPSTVLTAAHCVFEVDKSALTFAVGHDLDHWKQRVPVLDVGWYRDYDNARLGVNDLAYLHLARSIVAVTPVEYSRVPLYGFYRGRPFMYVGYGSAGPLAGQQRCVEIPVSAVCAGAFSNTAPDLEMCNGDSGGGVFYDDGSGFKLFGIISWGDSRCREYGVSTDVGAFQEFVGNSKNLAAAVPPARLEQNAKVYADPKDNAREVAERLWTSPDLERRSDFVANYKGRWVTWKGRARDFPRLTRYKDFCDLTLEEPSGLIFKLAELENGCGLRSNVTVAFEGSLDEYEGRTFRIMYAERQPVTEEAEPARIGEFQLVSMETSEVVSHQRRTQNFSLESDAGQWSGRVERCARINVEAPWKVDREVPINIEKKEDHAGMKGSQPLELSDSGFCLPLWAEGFGATDSGGSGGSRGVVSGYVGFGTVTTETESKITEVQTGKVYADTPLQIVLPNVRKRYELRLHLDNGRRLAVQGQVKKDGIEVSWDPVGGNIRLLVRSSVSPNPTGASVEAEHAGALTANDGVAQKAPASGTLRGTVMDDTGVPVPGAIVRVSGDAEAAVTGDSGIFNLSAPAGIYTPTFSKFGYLPVTATPLILVSGGSVDVGTIRLSPAPGGITGTIVSWLDASPVGGAVVSLAESGKMAVTDSSGNFTFTEPADTYTIAIVKSGYASETLPSIALAAGTVQLLGRIILAPNSAKVSGQVLASDGPTAISGAAVICALEGDVFPLSPSRLGLLGLTEGTPLSSIIIATSDDSGGFSVQLPPGNLSITLQASGYSGRTTSLVDLQPGMDVSLGALPLVHLGMITGRVIQAKTGTAIAGATVLIVGTSSQVTTDFAGTFKVAQEPGTYQLQVSAVGFQTSSTSLPLLAAGAILPAGTIILSQVQER
jgi:Trypsin/Carboxypeptidase regulatory-like domain